MRNSLPACHYGALFVAIVISLLIPLQSRAQDFVLQVTLRDTAGQGIVGIAIIVRAEDGKELARQTTGSDGGVSFSALSGIVRVAVNGQPRGGPRLYQLGDDARGVRVDLSQATLPLTLNLRAEADGLVLPDPATMLTREEGGPLIVDSAPFPTAAVATPARVPTEPQMVSAPSESDSPPATDWVPPVTLLIIVALVAVLRLVQQLRSAR
ncbi:MAG: hypothetical protein HGA45_36460 [Chloroflexales bacterium]|nr:hypothetical protein [Chloroflexales bacterium]